MEVLSVGAFDRFATGVIVCHFNKPKTATTVSDFIHNDLGRSDFTIFGEKLLKVLILHCVWHVGDVNIHEFY